MKINISRGEYIEYKKIQGFDNYYASDKGDIYSSKKGYLYKMSPFRDSRNLYKMIKLTKAGKRYSILIHRLVAQAYIPNPYNLLSI